MSAAPRHAVGQFPPEPAKLDGVTDDLPASTAGDPGRVRAIVFDLDLCLAPPDEAGKEAFAPALDAVRRANRGVLRPDALETALEDCWRFAFDDVAARHGFSEAMREAGANAFRAIRVTGPLRGYGDLDRLEAFDVPLVLVTSGFRALQESKVDALGIRRCFVDVLVDAIDEPDRRGKYRIFHEVLGRNGWRPGEVLVVGDNADSEIAAGNRLGMPTVQILRPGVVRDARACWHRNDLDGVRALVVEIHAGSAHRR